jgi:tRNA-2-methylthio-N6-dimethylallyladenosine synthase
VREKAESKALGKMGLLTSQKKATHNPKIVGAMGCMAQRLGQDIFKLLPNLHFSAGSHRPAAIPALLEKIIKDDEKNCYDLEEEEMREEHQHLFYKESTFSAFINILYGCNRFCSYCIVPFVRGREISRNASEIIEEARALVEKGVKEITLLGQSIMAYGRANAVWDSSHKSKLGFKEPLPRLLEALNEIEGLKRIRFTSGHPEGCSEELARAFAELPAVMPHLHLPVQSGSNRILEAMKRGYTAEEFEKATEILRARTTHLAFTTDIIVGFPTETEKDFEETRKLVQRIGFDNAFIFQYSPRPGTLAARTLKDDVSKKIKLERNHILLEDINKIAKTRHQKRQGNIEEILVEGVSKRNKSMWSGRTKDNLIAIFAPEACLLAGSFVNIKIERAEALTLYGKIVNNGEKNK